MTTSYRTTTRLGDQSRAFQLRPRITLDDNQRKAELSFACLSALSAEVGFTCDRGPYVDAWTVDAALRSGGHQIDVQLKATSVVQRRANGFLFKLGRRTYDNLRADYLDNSRSCPIILAILELPETSGNWLECTPENLVVRRCLWWESLAAYPEIDLKSKVITIPESQILTQSSLKKMMDNARLRLPLKEQGT